MPTPVYGLYAADAEWRLSQGDDFDVNLTSLLVTYDLQIRRRD